MLSAGTNVEWLRDDMGLIATAEESHAVAGRCETTDGVVYVPALLGLGTPHWDYGARGTLLGLTRGTDRAHVRPRRARRVSPSGAPTWSRPRRPTPGCDIPVLRIDGGMSRNPTFVQALADASGKPVEVSPVVEATTLGAGFLAGRRHGGLARPRGHVRTMAPERSRRARRPPRPGGVGRGRGPADIVDSRALGSGLLDCREMAFALPRAPRWARANAERRHRSTNAA